MSFEYQVLFVIFLEYFFIFLLILWDKGFFNIKKYRNIKLFKKYRTKKLPPITPEIRKELNVAIERLTNEKEKLMSEILQLSEIETMDKKQKRKAMTSKFDTLAGALQTIQAVELYLEGKLHENVH